MQHWREAACDLWHLCAWPLAVIALLTLCMVVFVAIIMLPVWLALME